MKVVYVAGAFRGKTSWDVAENVRNAERAGLEMVNNVDVMPIIPQANTALFDGHKTAEFWIEGTLELLRRCDAVYVFNPDHAKTSVGTKGEIWEANRLKIPVFYSLDDIKLWLTPNLA